MKFKDNAMLGASLLAVLGTGMAHAQTGVADSALQGGDIVVVGERVARGNNVVAAEQVAALPAAQNIVEAIKLVPGVQIRGGDAFNNDPWSYAINIRGFEVNLRNSKIGQTLDGVPLFNASYYLAGSPAQKFILAESVDHIQVNQGTADVGSPAAAALGGTIAYFSRDPSEEAGGLVRATFGDYDSRRYMGRYDTGRVFGNTRAYLAVADLDTHLWPHNGATPAGIEQFAVEGKSVSEFGALTMTLYGSYNDSDDDPIIEATRAFIEATGYSVDGSTSVWNPNQAAAVSGPLGAIGGNENWADDWAAVRENILLYAKFDLKLGDTLRIDVTPYGQRNEGIGEWLPPYQEPRFASTADPAALQQVLFAGSRIRTTRANNSGRAVLPYAAGGVERIYTALDGAVVKSSECFNADNTVRVSNGQDVCAQAQSYRNSEYYHRRVGVVANAEWELGDHTLRGGVWYENLDRDFGRAWKPYLDIRLGPVALDTVYRRDFAQNFQTDLWKVYVADVWNISERLTVSAGLQSYFVDIEGTSLEDRNFTAGVQTSTTELAVNSDSDDLLPSVGVVYDATNSLQVFAGYSRNFGAIGDWALEKTGTDLSGLEPETTDNYEAGVRFRGANVRGGATIYRNEYDNPIVFLTDDFAVGTPGINYSAGTGGTYFNVDGGIETSGVEGSIEFDVSDSLSLYLAASYIDATYTNDFQGASYGGNKVTVKAGSTVAGTPETIVQAALNYTNGPFTGRLSARHVGDAPGDAANTPSLVMPSYTVVDLSARYRVDLDAGRYLELAAGVNNLTDERYIGGMLDEFTQRFVVAAPRTTSFTVSLGF